MEDLYSIFQIFINHSNWLKLSNKSSGENLLANNAPLKLCKVIIYILL